MAEIGCEAVAARVEGFVTGNLPCLLEVVLVSTLRLGAPGLAHV